MRVPIITVVCDGGGAQRPGHLRTHVAKDALGKRDKIGAVRRIRLTELQGAVGSVLARDDPTRHGRGTRFDTVGMRSRSPLDRVALAVPETVWLPGLVHVVFEYHGWEVAIVFRVAGIVSSEAGEVLHVDLNGSCLETVAVVLVKPGTGGVVAVGADDDVGKCPAGTACLAHVTEPAALSAVGPFLSNVGDT